MTDVQDCEYRKSENILKEMKENQIGKDIYTTLQFGWHNFVKMLIFTKIDP